MGTNGRIQCIYVAKMNKMKKFVIGSVSVVAEHRFGKISRRRS